MRSEEEIREWLLRIERKLAKINEHTFDVFTVYCKGWVDALKWVLGEKGVE